MCAARNNRVSQIMSNHRQKQSFSRNVNYGSDDNRKNLHARTRNLSNNIRQGRSNQNLQVQSESFLDIEEKKTSPQRKEPKPEVKPIPIDNGPILIDDGPNYRPLPIDDGFIPDPRLEPLPIDDGFIPVPDIHNKTKRRTTGEELAEFIDGNKEAGAYDIDGNGRTTGGDVNLIMLYSMGVRGDALKPFIYGDASVEDVEKKLEQSFKEGAFDVNNDGVSGYRDARTILARLSLPSRFLPGFIQGNNNTGPGVERFIDEHKAVGAYDIDGDGETNAATDGTLIFHYLQGQRGADLQPFIVGNTSVKEVEQRLQEAVERGSFDVDNDGMAGYSDGLSIYLRLAGYSGEEILERLEWDKGFIPGPDVGQRPIEDGFIPDPRLEPLPIDDGSYPVPDVRPRDPMIDIA